MWAVMTQVPPEIAYAPYVNEIRTKNKWNKKVESTLLQVGAAISLHMS